MKHRNKVSWLVLGLAVLTLLAVFVIAVVTRSGGEPAVVEEPPPAVPPPAVAEGPSCSTPSRPDRQNSPPSPTLVKDIAPGRANGWPTDFYRFEDRLYFSAEVGNGERELWVSDGTEAGTSLLKDINPSGGSSPMRFATYKGVLYFAAEGSVEEGLELWRSDGTADGTELVKDINPPGPYAGSQPAELTATDDALFFAKYGDYAYHKLWKTDGTEAGTVQVNDVGSSLLTELDGKVLFAGRQDPAGNELWTSDGTDAGTFPLTTFGRSQPFFLTRVGNSVFFTGDTAAAGSELWKTDGTKAGTVLVADIVPGPESSNPYELVCVGRTLFFWGTDASGDTELWKSDGTAAGTTRVKDINPSGRGIPQEVVAPQKLVEVGGRLFFHADGGPESGVEVWTSDGTEVGTHIVEDIRPGPEGSSPTLLTDVDGTLYFAADDGKTGIELWRANADGTDAERVTDLHPKGASMFWDPGAHFVPLNGALYFGGRDGAHGYELWKLPL